MTANERALLAAAYLVACDHASAYQYSQAIATLQQHLNTATTDHTDLLVMRASLACWLGEAGRLPEAITAFENLLDDQLRVLDPDDPASLTTRHNLATYLGEAGRLAEAIAAFEQLLTDQRMLHYVVRVLGPDHPDTLTTRNNLAHCLREAGRAKEAAAVLHESDS